MIEWDENKNTLNREKHGLDFRIAFRILLSEDKETFVSGNSGTDAIRLIDIAPYNDVLCTLVYTLRGENTRVISLRPASERERRQYHEQRTHRQLYHQRPDRDGTPGPRQE